jgi:hypothetical protein
LTIIYLQLYAYVFFGAYNWSKHLLNIDVIALLAEPHGHIETWEDEEDEYLARAVYEHMKLNDEQV